LSRDQTTKTNALRLGWRIGVPTYETDESFAGLLQFLVANKAIVDEVSFFETITHHLYLPLEVFATRAAVLKRRIAALKEAGISAGINVLCTIGHINEGWDYMPLLPFQAMVGHDGAVSKSCACPNTPEFKAYIRQKYQLMAGAGPDFIWVDDDIRMHHHGVGFGCFCPTCMDLFSRRTGRAWMRETLVTAFNDPNGLERRQAWVNQNVQVLQTLMQDVREAIRGVNPGIVIGLMTAGPGWTTYSGQDIPAWLAALDATKVRPGGGFYSDEQPFGMYGKALEIGRQLVGCHAKVNDRQYELENFPYSALSKAVTSVINECTLALAAGCNGIAFNAIGALTGPWLSEREPLMERVNATRRMWEILVQHAGNYPLTGLYPVWDKGLTARRQVRQGDTWLNSNQWHLYDITRPQLLSELGLALAVEPSVGTILSGRVAEIYSDKELTKLLSGGVIMDTRALDVLAERGLADLAGVRLAHAYDNGVKETLTDDPLNGVYAGQDRCASIEFWGDGKGLGDMLEVTAPGVRVLANMRTYLNKTYGPCMTAFENRLGGRVVVAGYGPWMYLGSTAKREQLLNVADWVAKGQLPLRVREVIRLVPLVRLSADRKHGAVVLLNAGADTIAEATVDLRIDTDAVALLSSDGQCRKLATQPAEGGCRLALDHMQPWSTTILLIGGNPRTLLRDA